METQKLIYETPQVEIMEIEIEQAVLEGSSTGEGGYESDL